MASLPPPNQVAGRHLQLFEAYFKELDPKGLDNIPAIPAAKFLKNSGIPDADLSKIWDLSDPAGVGFLTRAGLFVSLKLIALAQNNLDISMSNIMQDTPPPMMGDATIFPNNIPTVPSSLPVISSIPVVPVDWSMKPMERVKYEQLFESLQPKNGFIPGNKVKGVLMDSKLPTDTLGKIWDLADMDKDGCLDKHEFIVAMHLVYKALEKFAIPSTLPPELLPASKRQTVSMNHVAQSNHIPASIAPPPVPPVPTIPWVVSKEEKERYDAMFKKADVDQDGYVNGPEIKHVFLSCNLPQNVLANVWSLADTNQIGKLNAEQFALAMWLVKNKLQGIELPSSLTPEMIPPSLRSTQSGAAQNTPAVVAPPMNPEMEMIMKDIEQLSSERLALQNDISQKEADIQITNGHVKSLQGELDALAATLRQLENQKIEASKRLGDLKISVDKIRAQANDQEEILSKQETELNSKKQELDALKTEEHDLEKKQKETNKNINKANTDLHDTALTITQIKGKITALEELQRQLHDAIQRAEDALIRKDASGVPDSCLNIEPEFKNVSYTRLINKNKEEPKEAAKDPFANSDAFANDPFNSATTNGDPFSATNKHADPFGDSKASADAHHGNKDPFGCDPFAAASQSTLSSGGPPPRPESPSPALPPKKSKQPPPRPAPPRPMQPTQPQPTSSTEFADFDNFNNKAISSPFSTTSNSSYTSYNSSHSMSNHIKSPIGTVAGGTTTPLDFTVDPFKDYRYEDPFNIADPFSSDNEDILPIRTKPDGSPCHSDSFETKNTFVTNGNSVINKDSFSNDPFFSNNSKFSNDPFNDSHKSDSKHSIDSKVFDPFGVQKNDPFSFNNVSKNTNNSDPFSFSISNGTKFSPSSLGKTSDPFSFSNNVPLGGSVDPFSFSSNKIENGNKDLPSEEQQLAWAAMESLKLEKEQKLSEEKEKEEIELAMKLSSAVITNKAQTSSVNQFDDFAKW